MPVVEFGNKMFSEWLFILGDNSLQVVDEDYITCLINMRARRQDAVGLIEEIYRNIRDIGLDSASLVRRAIVARINISIWGQCVAKSKIILMGIELSTKMESTSLTQES